MICRRIVNLTWLMLVILSPASLPGQDELPIPIRFGDSAPDPSRVTAPGSDGLQREMPIEPPSLPVDTVQQPSESPVAVRLLLPPRQRDGSPARATDQVHVSGTVVRTVSSLILVLGVFLLFVRFMRRSQSMTDHGQQVFHTLGRCSLLGKQAHIVKFGDKLLLLAKTATGLEKLAELSRPEEVERITSICQSGDSRALLARSVSQVLAGHHQPHG